MAVGITILHFCFNSNFKLTIKFLYTLLTLHEYFTYLYKNRALSTEMLILHYVHSRYCYPIDLTLNFKTE